jgi:hypothetical protein
MKTIPALLLAAAACTAETAMAIDYHVDFTRMQDYQQLRPLIDQCRDYDSLELYRDRMHKIANLNDMAYVFENSGYGLFNDCPKGIVGPGIEPVK